MMAGPAATTTSRTGDSRDLLLVSHNFPPTQGPESLLVGMNAKSLHDFGWNVAALTTTNRHARQGADADLLSVLPPAMEILRARSWDAYICAAFPRLGRKLMLWLEQQVLPEPYFLWRGSAGRTGRQWMQQRGQGKQPVIYSRAPKFVSNVVGLDLKRATGAPWVAHFSDPWTQVPRRGGKRVERLTQRMEREILAEADAVVFVSEQTADAIMKQYPEAWRKKVRVIPHGYINPSFPPTPSKPGNGRPLRALHAGSFYPGFREPDSLFKAIADLHARQSLQGRFELLCIGPDSTRYQKDLDTLGISSLVQLRDSVPFTECQKLVAEADLLVVLDTPNLGGLFLPTKLIEYMAFEKPILGLSESHSAVAETLRHCGLPNADIKDASSCARVLGTWLETWESGSWQLPQPTLEAMRSYELQRVNATLNDLLHELAPR